MALKDLNSAGILGQGLSSIAKTLLGLNNQFAGKTGPMPTLLTQFGLATVNGTPVGVVESPETLAAVQTLISAVNVPQATNFNAATMNRFTEQDIIDAQVIIQAAYIAIYVVAKVSASNVPTNNI